MPPSGFNQEAINGLLVFCRAIYKDLREEIRVGKKTEDQALEEEIKNIGNYLKDFKL